LTLVRAVLFIAQQSPSIELTDLAFHCYILMRNEWGKGGTISRAPNDCGGVEKSQQCHRYFLQYSTFASERPQARTWGR